MFFIGINIDDICNKVANDLGYELLKVPESTETNSNDAESLEYFEKHFN